MLRSAPDGRREFQILIRQLNHHFARDAESVKQLKHVFHTSLNLPVRILLDRARLNPHVTHRQRPHEFSAPGFIPAPLVQTLLECKQLCFRNGPLHPEQ